MNDLRKFLVSRMLLVLFPLILIEQLLMVILKATLLPLLSNIIYSGSAALKGADGLTLLLALRDLLFGGSAATFTLMQKSQGFFLAVLMLIIGLLPIIGGILLYSVMVERKLEALEAAYVQQRLSYEQQRNLMLSDFAHDLRTPIMTVSGYARALSDGMVKDESKQAEYLDAITRKSERLAELIDMLFAYVRLDSAGFRLKTESLDLHELLLSLAAACYTDFEEAGMTFEANVPEEPYLITADRGQLSRVIENLLKNALRHNPPGTQVLLSVKQLPAGEDITIADSGIAIEKSPSELFRPFVRGNAARSGHGSGLGLSIAKKVSDMHGFQLLLRQPCEGYTKAFVLRVFGE